MVLAQCFGQLGEQLPPGVKGKRGGSLFLENNMVNRNSDEYTKRLNSFAQL